MTKPARIRSAHMHPLEWSPWHPWFAWLPRRTLSNEWVWGRCERAIRIVEVGWRSYMQTHYRRVRDALDNEPANVLRRLYGSEINFSLSVFWDGGWDWALGDDMNGWKEGGNRDTLDEAIAALADSARRHYPRSLFATGKEPAGETPATGSADNGRTGSATEPQTP